MSEHCPVCRTEAAEPVVALRDVPVVCHHPYRTAEEAKAVSRANIELACCTTCDHVFNRAFDESRISYEAGYDNALHHSPRFRAYAEDLVERLCGLGDLRGDRVIEIGAGDGFFLDLLCRRSAAIGTGFDPATAPDGAAGERWEVRPTKLPADSELKARLVVARHIVEHLANPAEFVARLRSVLDDAGHLYVEVPNAEYMVRRSVVWDLLYEHGSYFTAASMTALLDSQGFSVDVCYSVFNEQYLAVIATPGSCAGGVGIAGDWPTAVSRFGESIEREIARWSANLADHRTRGSRVALWGAGTKGVMFLNAVDRQRTIDVVIDVNPGKQRTFVAGTGHEVSAPDALMAGVDVILLMNPVYRNEVDRWLAKHGVRCEVREVQPA